MSGRVLLLIRHAKAVADAPTDAQRELAARGRRDAEAAGRWLAGLDIALDLAIVSPATRARETLDGIAASVAIMQTTVDGRIYDNVADGLLAVIVKAPDEVRTLVLVGHNPSMHGLAVALDDGEGDPDACAAIRSAYPTCGIAIFDVTGSWRDLGPGGATLRAFDAPRG